MQESITLGRAYGRSQKARLRNIREQDARHLHYRSNNGSDELKWLGKGTQRWGEPAGRYLQYLQLWTTKDGIGQELVYDKYSPRCSTHLMAGVECFPLIWNHLHYSRYRNADRDFHQVISYQIVRSDLALTLNMSNRLPHRSWEVIANDGKSRSSIPDWWRDPMTLAPSGGSLWVSTICISSPNMVFSHSPCSHIHTWSLRTGHGCIVVPEHCIGEDSSWHEEEHQVFSPFRIYYQWYNKIQELMKDDGFGVHADTWYMKNSNTQNCTLVWTLLRKSKCNWRRRRMFLGYTKQSQLCKSKLFIPISRSSHNKTT